MSDAIEGASVIRLPPALSAEGLGPLAAALDAALAGPAPVVVLAGADEDTFCLGLDFVGLADDPSPALRRFADLLAQLAASDKPLVAAVEGRALGGGAGLAIACDTVIAGAGTRFGFPEVLFGLLPWMVMPFLLERVPPQKVRRLIMRGASVDAREALAIGLADVVAEAGRLDACVRGEVRQLRRQHRGGVRALCARLAHAGGRDVSALVEQGRATLQDRLEDRALRDALVTYATDGIAPWIGADDGHH